MKNISVLSLSLFLFSSWVFAEEAVVIDAIRIIGTTPKDEISKPNSAHVVSVEKLEQQQQTDVNRVLKQVPGVYVQEEDAYGLRPNIGLRGTHPHRSRKVVLLEDGILIGPAPYSAPAAYYTPFMSKIESLEVFKGVSSVPYGPNSIGGAVNYITRSIPQKSQREVDFSAGSFDFRKSRLMLGQKWDHHGLLIEASRVETSGFKKIDTGVSDGFSKNDVLIKGQHLLTEHLNQELSWKLGYADEDSKETYLGLTLDDFTKSPYRRYAASEKDEMIWDHGQVQVSYKLNPRNNWGLWASLYHHQFHRNWSRLNNFTGTAPGIYDILKNPYSPANQAYYRVLIGEVDSNSLENLVIANNNRFFFSEGIQLGSVNYLISGDALHQFKTQVRLHQDQIERRHTEDIFEMLNGRLVKTGAAQVQSTTNTDRSVAITVSVEDEISWRSWKWTLAMRTEQVEYDSRNDLTEVSSGRRESVLVPGVGVLYQFDERWSVLAGLNKGVTLVGPNAQESQKPEESINAETGVRFQDAEADFFAEAIFFAANYSNIKGTCSFSSGCVSNQLDQEFDGGRAEIRGLEARLVKLFSYQKIYFPVSLNATVTRAHFAADTESSNPEWGVGKLKSGDPLPYIPQANYSLNLGTQYRRWSQDFVITWNGEMADQALATGREYISAHGVVDWSGRYKWNEQGSVYARIDNLLDKEYLVSLRPFGARPGKDRTLQVGLKYQF